MAQPYSQSRELHLKLVLYGPAAAGKTSALNHLYRSLRPDVRGQLVAVNTGNDRTLFFDFYPPPPARLLGVALHIQIYTASGGIQNDATRRSLLAGADGILFMADSRRGRERDNILALEQMRNCLFDLNMSLDQVPLVLAWNKRDLPDALSVGELEAGLNVSQAPSFATVAQLGQGIFDSFRALASRALDSTLKRKPEVLHGGPRVDIGQSSDVVTSRRVLAMQDTQRAMTLLQGRYMPESAASNEPAPYQDTLESSNSLPQSQAAPVSTTSPGGVLSQGDPAAASGTALRGGPPSFSGSGFDAPRRDPSRPMHAVPLHSDVSAREDGIPARRATMSGQRVVLEPTDSGAELSGQSLPPSLRDSQQIPGTRSGRFDSQPAGGRDVWFSHLLPAGALRAQLQDVERQVWAGQWSAGVRRAASIFYALTAAEATREPDEGPAWRGLVLGLPVERYLRFRQAVQDAEAGKCSLEDGLFALFFLLDAALRKEAWLTRGA